MMRKSLLAILWTLLAVPAVWAAEAWQDLNGQAITLYRDGRNDQARTVAEMALQRAESEFGSEAPETALSLNNLALIRKTQGNYDEATRLYERSPAIAEKIAGPRSEDLLVPLNNLAFLYESRGQKEKADDIYQRIEDMGHSVTAHKIRERARNGV